MLPFDLPEFDDHEQVCVGRDRDAGLFGVVAIHSTARGPALGGCRMVPYQSGADAYVDALRLSQAMSYKNALAGLPHGGGKAVIWADPARAKTPELLRAMGRFIATLHGRYITAGDVGISVGDLDVIGEVNPWTTGRSPDRGGAGDSGILTAFGVWQGMRASAEHMWGTPELTDRVIGIEGVGKVGRRLAAHLVKEAGARVFVTDPNPEAIAGLVQEVNVTVVGSRAELLAQALDVYSPNALGQVLTPQLAAGLTASIVCGGANNQVADANVPQLLADRGVLYAPDFLVNCGGVVQVADEVLGFDEQRARLRVSEVFATAQTVFARAQSEGLTPVAAATLEAKERIEAGAGRPFATPAGT
ncbi:MAG: Glu/Leu/Phe/Val dehydrogenase dimerization domain-containing protein [Candidatus Nanopelagicales bacterium]